MTNDGSKDLKQGLTGAIVLGVVLILVGVAAIAFPLAATLVAETWVAIILAIAGVTKLIYAWQTRGEGFIWKLLLSLLYIGTGLVLWLYPLQGVLTLTLVLGIFLLTEGIMEIILGFQLRPTPNWGWVVGNGIITLILGGMIGFEWPLDAPWLLGTLLGISILSTGVSRVMLAWVARSTLTQA
ncbi:MAG: HdeD family acid-resistance protein [Aphanocapsa sp. GSE-SYN-MK-11-07L]|jgi:uncharacterized membrane protein HdeD (DUF308 family)|nr:HdeD family acid-resistance protein [Aphanocapsa sp. GSE-SYN-MK-11-07L]